MLTYSFFSTPLSMCVCVCTYEDVSDCNCACRPYPCDAISVLENCKLSERKSKNQSFFSFFSGLLHPDATLDAAVQHI